MTMPPSSASDSTTPKAASSPGSVHTWPRRGWPALDSRTYSTEACATGAFGRPASPNAPSRCGNPSDVFGKREIACPIDVLKDVLVARARPQHRRVGVRRRLPGERRRRAARGNGVDGIDVGALRDGGDLAGSPRRWRHPKRTAHSVAGVSPCFLALRSQQMVAHS